MSNQQANLTIALKFANLSDLDRLVATIDKVKQGAGALVGQGQRWTPQSAQQLGMTVSPNGNIRNDLGQFQGRLGGIIPGTQGLLSKVFSDQFGNVIKTMSAAAGFTGVAGVLGGGIWGGFQAIQQRSQLESFGNAIGQTTSSMNALDDQLLKTAKTYGVASDNINKFVQSLVQAGGYTNAGDANKTMGALFALKTTGIRDYQTAIQQYGQRTQMGGSPVDEQQVDAIVAMVLQNPRMQGRGDEIYQAIMDGVQSVIQTTGSGNVDAEFQKFALMQNQLAATGQPGLMGQYGAQQMQNAAQGATSGPGFALVLSQLQKEGVPIDLATMNRIRQAPQDYLPELARGILQAAGPNASDEQLKNLSAIFDSSLGVDIVPQFLKAIAGVTPEAMQQFQQQFGQGAALNNPSSLALWAKGKAGNATADDVIQYLTQTGGMSQSDAQAWVQQHGTGQQAVFQAIQSYGENTGQAPDMGTFQRDEADLTNLTTQFVQSGRQFSYVIDGLTTDMQGLATVMQGVLDHIPGGDAALKKAGQAAPVAGPGISFAQNLIGKAVNGITTIIAARVLGKSIRAGIGKKPSVSTDPNAPPADFVPGAADAAAAAGGDAAATAGTSGAADAAGLGLPALGVVGAITIGSTFLQGLSTGGSGDAETDALISMLKAHPELIQSVFANPPKNVDMRRVLAALQQKYGGSGNSVNLPPGVQQAPATTQAPPTGVQPYAPNALPGPYAPNHAPAAPSYGIPLNNHQTVWHGRQPSYTPQGAQGSSAYGGYTQSRTYQLQAQQLQITDASGLAAAFTAHPLSTTLTGETINSLSQAISRQFVLMAAVNAAQGIGRSAFSYSTTGYGGGAAYTGGAYKPASRWDGSNTGAYGVVVNWAQQNGGDAQRQQSLAIGLLAMGYGESGGDANYASRDAGNGAMDYGFFNFNAGQSAAAGLSPQQMSDPGTTLNLFGGRIMSAFNQVYSQYGPQWYNNPDAFRQFWAAANGASQAGVNAIPNSSVAGDVSWAQGAYAASQGQQGPIQTTSPGASAGVVDPSKAAGTATAAQLMGSAQSVAVFVTGRVTVDMPDGRSYQGILRQDTPLGYASAPTVATATNA